MSTTSDDETTSTNTSRPPPNFSRPKPLPSQPQTSALKSSSDAARKKAVLEGDQPRRVHIVDAFHDSEKDNYLPAEPDFSDVGKDTNWTSNNAEGGDGEEEDPSPWNGHEGEIDSRRRKKSFDGQRYERSVTSNSSRPNTAKRISAESMAITPIPPTITATVRASPILHDARAPAQILKRVSVDQRSEHIAPPSSYRPWEDTSSHHTVSSSGEDSGSFDLDGRWQSSDHDTSGLAPEEVRKLEKKGINPALYVEMKEAKEKGKKAGGKKWVGSLVGNGFLN